MNKNNRQDVSDEDSASLILTEINKNRLDSHEGSSDADECCDGRRKHHNMQERKRRNNIKSRYATLKELIPTIADKNVSRRQILKATVDHIRRRTDRIRQLEAVILELEDKNTKVDGQIEVAKRNMDYYVDYVQPVDDECITVDVEELSE